MKKKYAAKMRGRTWFLTRTGSSEPTLAKCFNEEDARDLAAKLNIAESILFGGVASMVRSNSLVDLLHTVNRRCP